jgi:predicted nuclease with TOPRIM domain
MTPEQAREKAILLSHIGDVAELVDAITTALLEAGKEVERLRAQFSKSHRQLRAQLDEAKTEIDELRIAIKSLETNWREGFNRVKKERDEARAKLDEARKALEPFARMSRLLDDDLQNSHIIIPPHNAELIGQSVRRGNIVTVGDIHQAAAVLEKLKAP